MGLRVWLTQVAENLPSKCKALTSNCSTAKEKRRENTSEFK
jgi:hypothetical protein